MSSSSALSGFKKNSFINIALILIGFAIVYFRSNFSGLTIEIVLFILSLIVLVRAADIFTDAAVILGERMGLSKLNTGILIIAIGTSAPELFSSVGAAMQGQPDMVVGNVLGTVVANCLLGIGIATLFAKQALDVHREVISTQMSMFFVAVLLTSLSLYDGHMSQLEGGLLLVVLGFYLHHNIRHSGGETALEEHADVEQIDTQETKDSDSATISTPLLSVFLLINLACLFISGDFVVSSLLNSAEALGLSSAKLATSVLAIGTSIPEIATAIMLVRKNNTDSLFGEIIGSNIFDYLGIFGVIALINPITMSGPLLNFLILSSIAAFCLLYIIMNDRKVRRIEGIALLALFAGFLIQLVSI
ncbi:MAG: sodium:calcium antiporter [Arenicellales bacterium]